MPGVPTPKSQCSKLKGIGSVFRVICEIRILKSQLLQTGLVVSGKCRTKRVTEVPVPFHIACSVGGFKYQVSQNYHPQILNFGTACATGKSIVQKVPASSDPNFQVTQTIREWRTKTPSPRVPSLKSDYNLQQSAVQNKERIVPFPEHRLYVRQNPLSIHLLSLRRPFPPPCGFHASLHAPNEHRAVHPSPFVVSLPPSVGATLLPPASTPSKP